LPRSIGLPTFSAPTAFVNSSSNSSAIASSMMKRFAAMQLWPLFWLRARHATVASVGRSGVAQDDERVRTAQLQDRFLQRLAAAAATNEPAPSEPVSVTPATRRSETMPSTGPEPIIKVWKTPSGTPAFAKHLLYGQRALGNVRRVLQHHHVAGRQRGQPCADAARTGNSRA